MSKDPLDYMYGNFPVFTKQEKFHDVKSHRSNWRAAIEAQVTRYSMGICRCPIGPESSPGECYCDANRSYWEHELEVFDKTFDLLETEFGLGEN